MLYMPKCPGEGMSDNWEVEPKFYPLKGKEININEYFNGEL